MPVQGRFGRRLLAVFGGLAAILIAPVPAAQANDTLVVFAAASLKNALDAVNVACKPDSGETAKISYAASSALARQIEQGAPADIYISADLDWMKYLADKGLIKTKSEVRLLGNKIVLISPKEAIVEAKVEKGFDLGALLGNGRLAIGDVKAVPAGRYGKAALQSLGLWDGVKDKLAQAENVRAALKLVSLGEAPLGVVYATDAVAEPGVKVVSAFPDNSHPPIIYPAALTAASKAVDAPAFLKCLQTDKAHKLFEAQGFFALTPSEN